jgi:hypothetical protein
VRGRPVRLAITTATSSAAPAATATTAPVGGRRPGLASRTAPAAAASATLAASEPVRPRRCGSPRTPVRASASRSGSVFVKCAAAPSSAAASIAQPGGSARSGPHSVTNAGSAPNASAYGTTLAAVRFNPRSYPHAIPTAARCTAAALTPQPSDSSAHAVSAVSAATRSVPAATAPVAAGLSVRPAARSRSASSQSFAQPTESCPASAAAATHHAAAPSPAATASAVAIAVTATHGPKCAQRRRSMACIQAAR